jgi:hypothetical protein
MYGGYFNPGPFARPYPLGGAGPPTFGPCPDSSWVDVNGYCYYFGSDVQIWHLAQQTGCALAN